MQRLFFISVDEIRGKIYTEHTLFIYKHVKEINEGCKNQQMDH